MHAGTRKDELVAVARWPETDGGRTDLADVAHRAIVERNVIVRAGARNLESPAGTSDIAIASATIGSLMRLRVLGAC